MKQKVIIKNVNGFYDGQRKFVVIPVDGKTRRKLSEFCEVPESEELLFSVSTFAAVSSVDGEDYADAVGNATFSVKLETTEYDWSYKSKKGHTKKWQVCGLLFKSPVTNGNLEGLYDD